MLKAIQSGLVLGLLLTAGCASHRGPVATAPTAITAADAATEALAREIGARFDDANFANAHFGVLIKSLDTGKVLYERNAERLFMPASNQKILTTASALINLGPDFTFDTVVSHTGEIKGDTLDGDLVVIGNGDPTLYTRFHKDSRDVFRQWADKLKERGITTISGSIIGDDDAWSDSHTGNGWPFDDLTPWYYAEFGPLTLNENYIDITITPPAEVGGEVTLTPNVPSSYFKLINKLEVVADGRNSIEMSRPHFSNEITISGRVKAGGPAVEETPTITNPTLWYVWVLKETLEAEGITVRGDAVDCDAVEGWAQRRENLPVIVTQKSPPLSEILMGLMKRSQNMYAETMIYAQGQKAAAKGTFSNGRKAIQDALATIGVEPDEYQYSDGSGLSRYNYVSPAVLVRVYEEMLKGPFKDFWWEAQAVAGEQGTLRNRGKGPLARNMRGKTGLISNVRALSGYVKSADGEQFAFSFLCNGHTRSSGELDALYDGVATLLAEKGAPPVAAEKPVAGN